MSRPTNAAVSILLPVYNAAPYLRECLDSVLAQSDPDWELLAVNDFSTDTSPKILHEYAARDPRIRVSDNQMKGIIPALRTAYAASKGRYLTRMDADDKMSSDKLRALRTLLQQHGRGHLAVGRVSYFAEGELGAGYERYAEWLNGLTAADRNFTEIYKECVIPSPAWMLHREDLEACGAFTSDVYPEDYDLCFRFYEKGLQPVGTTETVHYWRDHSARTSRNDAVYADNRYFGLKVPYFLRLEQQTNRPLVLWGAGKKGKRLAQRLAAAAVPFHWVCNNPRKWGTQLHTATLAGPATIDEYSAPQIIVAVAAPDGRREIEAFMREREMLPGEDFYFFC